MTSKERLICALNHKEPDRVPIDFGSTRMTGIMAIAYKKLRKYIGLNTNNIKVYDIMQQLALIDDDIMKRFEIDIVGVEPKFPRVWKEDYLSDGSKALFPNDYKPYISEGGIKILIDIIGYFGYNYNLKPTFIMKKNCPYYEFAMHPLESANNEEDVDNFKWFWEIPEVDLSYFREKIGEYSNKNEHGLLANTLMDGWGQHLEVLQNLRGWDTFLVDIYTNKKLAKYMLEKRQEYVLKRWDIMLDAIDNKVDVVTMGEDMGTQHGPIMSVEIYREILKPIHKKFVDFIKRKTNAKIWMHNCGSIYDFIPDYIDLGIDILNPVQVSARNMDSRKLKREFGDRIVFWGGGCDSQTILPFGKPEEVKDEVKRRIDDFGPGGGFVFAPIMNIQLDVPPENIIAMFETAIEYGKY